VSVSRWHITQLLYSVHANDSLLSPDTDDPPDTTVLTSSVESGVDSVSMFRGQEVIRQDYVYSLAVLGIVQSRENLANALTSAWQTAYGMSSVQTVYCILAASKGWIKQTYRKIMHTQMTKMIKLCSDILLQNHTNSRCIHSTCSSYERTNNSVR